MLTLLLVSVLSSSGECRMDHFLALDPKYQQGSKVIDGMYLVACEYLTAKSTELVYLATKDPKSGKRTPVVAKLLVFKKGADGPWALSSSALAPAPNVSEGPLRVGLVSWLGDQSIWTVEACANSERELQSCVASAWSLGDSLTKLVEQTFTSDSSDKFPKTIASTHLSERPRIDGSGVDFMWHFVSGIALSQGVRPLDCRDHVSQITWLCGRSGKWTAQQAPCLSDLVKATSSTVLASKVPGAYAAANVLDGSHDTAWVEGKKGSSAGEWIRLDFAKALTLAFVDVTGGYAKNDDTLKQNNRLKRARLTLSDGSVIERSFVPQLTDQTFRIEPPRPLTWVMLEVLEVYPGTKFDDTAISEIILSPPIPTPTH